MTTTSLGGDRIMQTTKVTTYPGEDVAPVAKPDKYDRYSLESVD